MAKTRDEVRAYVVKQVMGGSKHYDWERVLHFIDIDNYPVRLTPTGRPRVYVSCLNGQRRWLKPKV